MASLTSARSLRSSLMYTASVASLFAAGEIGVWFDSTDITTLYQDVAGTTPITAPGQTCALMRDKSGNAKHATQPTAAQRPTYGVIPYGGVRNLANGSGAVSDVSYWPAGTTVNGVVYTKLASGVGTDGLPYADYSVVGTASSTAFFDIYAIANSRITSGIGQTFTASMLATVLTGTIPPLGFGAVVGVVGETAPTTIVENFTISATVPATETLLSITSTFVNAATNQARASVYLRTGTGTAVNYTIRIKALQFEKAAARSAFQLNLSKYNVTEAGKASIGALFADGIDDGMVTSSINFSGTDKVTVWAGLQKMSDAAAGMLAELSSNAALVGNTGSFYLSAPNLPLPSDRYGFFSRGSALAALGQTSLVSNGSAPDVAILTALGDISSDASSLSRNGAAGTGGAADQGTGDYGNYPLYLFRRGGASLPYNGIFTGLIVRGAASSASQISLGNGALNAKLGAY